LGTPHFSTIDEVTAKHLSEAVNTREQAMAMLEQLAVLCAPRLGEEVLLKLLSLIACQKWLDGDLRVEITASKMYTCRIRLLRSIGVDEFESVKRLEEVKASALAFKEAAEKPQIVGVLRLTKADKSCLQLDATNVKRQASIPPPEMAESKRRIEAQRWRMPQRTAPMPMPMPDHIRNALEGQRVKPAAAEGLPIARIATVKRQSFPQAIVELPGPNQSPQSASQHSADVQPARKPLAQSEARKRTSAYVFDSSSPPPMVPPQPSRKDETVDVDLAWDEFDVLPEPPKR